MNFASHVDSQTEAIVDIESSSIPEGRSEAGMLVYRVDGREINPAGCVDSADGEYPRGRGECWCIGWMGVRSTQLAVWTVLMVSIPEGGGNAGV